MTAEGSDLSTVFERIARDVLATLGGLPDVTLNQTIAIPEANSLYAAATHLIGAAEFWTLQLAGGRYVERDRAAEFRATGTGEALAARYERWILAMHDVVDALSEAELSEPGSFPPGYRPTLTDAPLTRRGCLLHVVEHSSLHLGHLQLTRQLVQAGQAP